MSIDKTDEYETANRPKQSQENVLGNKDGGRRPQRISGSTWPLTPPVAPDEEAKLAAKHLVLFIDYLYGSKPLGDRGQRIVEECRVRRGQSLELITLLVAESLRYLDSLDNATEVE